MNFNFCRQCGTRLINLNDTEYICEQGHKNYNEPSPTVSVILVKGGKILFSKRAGEPNKGMYDLPGGFFQYGEAAFEVAKREMKEETGLDLEINQMQLLATYPGFYNEGEPLCEIMIYVRTWSGEPHAADDSAALEWKDADFINSPEFAPNYPGLRGILKDLGVKS